jgi:hypothetical protein
MLFFSDFDIFCPKFSISCNIIYTARLNTTSSVMIRMLILYDSKHEIFSFYTLYGYVLKFPIFYCFLTIYP